MSLARLGFFAIVSGIALTTVVWWVWAHRRTRGRERFFVAAWVAPLLLFMAAFFIWPAAARRSHFIVPMAVLAIAYLWLLIIAPGSVILVFCAWVSGRLRRKAPVAVEERRGFLRAASVAAPPLLTLGGAGYAMRTLGEFRVRKHVLSLPALPAALDGLTIAHVADLHVGKFTRDSDLERAVETVRRMDADLVLNTGDLIDFSLADLDQALDVAGRMQGRHGQFLVEGNHDRFDDGDKFRRRVRADGRVRLLLDESAALTIRGERVQLLGLTWKSSKSDRPEVMGSLNAQRDRAAFPILLGHHPHAFDLHDDLPLTLAGHTHGGQINFREGVGVAALLYRYWTGVYERGDQRLVVSNGVGNWYPVRIQAPAEIVHLTLRRTES